MDDTQPASVIGLQVLGLSNRCHTSPPGVEMITEALRAFKPRRRGSRGGSCLKHTTHLHTQAHTTTHTTKHKHPHPPLTHNHTHTLSSFPFFLPPPPFPPWNFPLTQPPPLRSSNNLFLDSDVSLDHSAVFFSLNTPPLTKPKLNVP